MISKVRTTFGKVEDNPLKWEKNVLEHLVEINYSFTFNHVLHFSFMYVNVAQ